MRLNRRRSLSPDPQQSNASGASFPFNRGILVVGEIQLVYPQLGGLEEPGAGAPLGHVYRFGAWYDSRRSGDLQIDNTGQSLASPTSAGVPRQHQGSYSFYAVADQMVWRDAKNPNRSASVFGRAMGTPESDRGLVDYSANGGVVYHAPFISRPDDVVGLGFGYAHVSNRAAAFDRDTALLNLTSGVAGYSAVRSSETFAERWPPWRHGMELDAGLFFVCYQRDPAEGFVRGGQSWRVCAGANHVFTR